MAEKILNILLLSLVIVFAVVFGIKTVFIDVVKKDKDKEWEENKNNPDVKSVSVPYTLSIDSRFDK